MVTEAAVRAAAAQARVDLVFAACAPLRGLDVELVSEHVHAVNPIRGRLLTWGGRPPGAYTSAIFGVGHLVLDEGDWPQSTLNVHPANVLELRALPTVHNVERVLSAPVGDL